MPVVGASQPILKRIAWLFLNAGLVVGLGFATISLLLGADYGPRIYAINGSQLIVLAILQLLCLLLSVLVWLFTLRDVEGIGVSFRSAVVHVAFMLCAKYIPGKVWGLIARGALIERSGASVERILNCTLVEQLFVLFSGCAVGATFLLAGAFGLQWLVLLLLVLLVLPSVFNGLIQVIFLLLRIFPRIFERLPFPQCFTLERKIVYRLFLLYSLQWIAIGAVMIQLAFALDLPADPRIASFIVGALAIAVIAGFVVLFIPGGIGVREGVLVAVLSPFIGFESSVMLSACHRIWITLYDLLVGCVGLLLHVLESRRGMQ